MKTTTYRCDCGKCDASAEEGSVDHWLTLDQPRLRMGDNENLEPKLARVLHFATLECLKEWIDKAVEVLPGLQKTASGLRPRGNISSPDLPGLYV